MDTTYIIGGGKGGVGKSIVSHALIDYVKSNGKKVTIVETDTSNPDVELVYEEDTKIQVEYIDLDKKDGWLTFIDILEKTEGTIVVNLASRSNVSVNNYGKILTEVLPEIKGELRTIWVINRQRDSIELLQKYREIIPGKVDVLMNGYFGDKEKFSLFAGSKTKKDIGKEGGKTALFPDLADRVTDEMNVKRMSILDAGKSMSLSSRAELSRWKKEVENVFQQLGI